jgi:hypothetical protein
MVCRTETHMAVSNEQGLSRHTFFERTFRRRRCRRPRGLSVGFEITGGIYEYVCCECCVLSGSGLSDGSIARTEESYRMWCV